MGHHGTKHIPTEEELKNWKENYKQPTFEDLQNLTNVLQSLGATNKFPDGKINDDDDGQIAIGITLSNDKLIIHFGDKPIKWIGFSKEEAKDFAETILNKIKE